MGGSGREWEGVGGSGREWEGVGGSGREWEGVGGSGREWEGVGGSGREWEGVGGSGREGEDVIQIFDGVVFDLCANDDDPKRLLPDLVMVDADIGRSWVGRGGVPRQRVVCNLYVCDW